MLLKLPMFFALHCMALYLAVQTYRNLYSLLTPFLQSHSHKEPALSSRCNHRSCTKVKASFVHPLQIKHLAYLQSSWKKQTNICYTYKN